MAMLRSAGSTSFMRWPPMLIAPDEMDSSPAIMRSVVDLPQPEGPRKIMNSPSWMSSDTSRTAGTPFG